MELAEIDITKFKAYSTTCRSVASLAACHRNVPTGTIMKAGMWKSSTLDIPVHDTSCVSRCGG